MKKAIIKADVDDHVFIWIQTDKKDDRPDISLDLHNAHGRRSLSVRVNGMCVASLLVDMEELSPAGSHDPERFCPICGDEINLISSKGHACKDK